MRNEDFNKLIEYYSKLRDRCMTLNEYNKAVMGSLAVNEYNSIVKLARELTAEMDKFHIDLYHILGMANLTASQTAKFCKLTKEIGCTRSHVKNISGYQLIEIPNDTKKSDFKLSCGLKLKSEVL